MGERGVEFEWEEKEGGRCWREREGENVSWRERERGGIIVGGGEKGVWLVKKRKV